MERAIAMSSTAWCVVPKNPIARPDRRATKRTGRCVYATSARSCSAHLMAPNGPIETMYGRKPHAARPAATDTVLVSAMPSSK
jgi:hypothetical protein